MVSLFIDALADRLYVDQFGPFFSPRFCRKYDFKKEKKGDGHNLRLGTVFYAVYLFSIKHNTFISRILELRKGVSLCRKKEIKNALQWVTDEHSCQFANEKSSISLEFFFRVIRFEFGG